MIALQLTVGLALLVVGGDAFVRGAVAIARRLGVSSLVIGLTLVGFGTSMPELVTSLRAAQVGSPGIAVGNVVGSNIANILLILGLAALIYPLQTSRAAFRRDGAVLAATAVICVAMVLVGRLSRPVGMVLVLLLVAYVVLTLIRERVHRDAAAVVYEAETTAVAPAPRRLWVALVLAAGGLVLTILGTRSLVTGAIAFAEVLGVPESVVGVTVVAVGTSLPELVTSVMAAVRRQADVAFGNIVGSNIFNVLGILGATAVLQPIPVPPQLLGLDIWVMLGATMLLLGFAASGWRLNRWEGAAFIAAYAAYITGLAVTAS